MTPPHGNPNTFHLHDYILQHSPFLFMLMDLFESNTCFEVTSSPGFNCPHAFYLALKRLYGSQLVDLASIRHHTLEGFQNQNIADSSFDIEVCMIDFALCYATSGVFLDRQDITEQGFKLALGLMSMANVEYIVKFALYPELFMLKSSYLPCTLTNDAPSMFPNYHTTHVEDFKTRLVHGLMTEALIFLGSRIPADFPLFTGYFDSHLITRIPHDLQTLPGSVCVSNALAHLQLGSIPSLKEQQPAHEILITSAILMSIPYECLIVITQRMKEMGTLSVELLEKIVAAREQRRNHALHIYERTKSKIADPFINARYMGFSEYVVKQETIGEYGDCFVNPIIRRRWTGFQAVDSMGNLGLRANGRGGFTEADLANWVGTGAWS